MNQNLTLIENLISKTGGLKPSYQTIINSDLELKQALLNIGAKFCTNNFREIIYIIKNNITTRVKCNNCNNPVNFIKNGIFRNQYFKFCSLKCSNNSKEVKLKKQNTSLKNFGVTNPSKSEIIQNKKINTSIKKHSCKYPWQQNKNIKLLEDKSNLILLHHKNKNTLTEIAKIANVDVSVVGNYFQKHNINVQNFVRSDAEKEIVDFLEKNKISNIMTNVRSIIPPLELDIFLPDYNIAIEYCGLYWHSHFYKPNNYHLTKLNLCNEKGIRLLTMFENEWIHTKEIVKQKLLHILQKSTTKKIFARNTDIISLTAAQKMEFFNKTHIQGNGPGSITYGLKNQNILVAAMTFIKQQNDVFVLNRYATSLQVVGGFTKILNHFQQSHKWNKIVSFADLRWSNGEIYKNTGFLLDKILPPDYYYVVRNCIVHKFNYRRKNLPKMLEDFDPNLSETENTSKNHIPRIYNCGLKRYIMNY